MSFGSVVPVVVVDELLCQQTEEMHQGPNTDTGAPCRAGFGFGLVPAIAQLNWVYPPVHRGVETSASRACTSSHW